jgi:hypothetical protein
MEAIADASTCDEPLAISSDPPQKSRRDSAVHVAHDGLVHLDLIVAPNLCAMRFEARPIDVVVVAANQS